MPFFAVGVTEPVQAHEPTISRDERVAHETASRCNARDLRVAVAGDFADRERVVPRRARQRPRLLSEERRLVRGWRDGEFFVLVRRHRIRSATVIAEHATHVLGVAIVTGERPELARHLGRRLVRHPRHQCRDRGTPSEAFLGIVRKAELHQQRAHIRVAKAERAVHVRTPRDLGARELRHKDADLERERPDAAGIGELARVEVPRFVEKGC